MTARRYISVPDGGSGLSLAEERGYDPTPDDVQPAPRWAAERFGGDGFEREVRALRIVGQFTRCSHPHCRTSLTDESVNYCGHDLPFCEDCTWEDGCAACDALADGALAHIDDEGPAE